MFLEPHGPSMYTLSMNGKHNLLVLGLLDFHIFFLFRRAEFCAIGGMTGPLSTLKTSRTRRPFSCDGSQKVASPVNCIYNITWREQMLTVTFNWDLRHFIKQRY